ncbi:MAG: FKBP-type peptidyl-prolyl cis-trans isomerase N-terminal domain-containing protein [Candidatus Acidiferrales bacterium]
MKNTFVVAVTLIVVGIIGSGSARAQQAAAPASNSQQAPAASAPADSTPTKPAGTATAKPAAKPQSAAAAKPAADASAEKPAAKSGQAAAAKPAAGAAAAKPAAKPGQAAAAKPAASAAAAKKTAPLVLKTDRDKVSYAIGMNIGSNLKKQSEDFDGAIVQRGLNDALAGGKTLLTEDEAKAALTALQVTMRKKQDEMRKQQEEAMRQAAETNKKEGDAFLADNKTKDGVVTLASGLQYKILTPGTGPKPAATDTVVCNYVGTLVNGTEFDASAKHGGPATFPVTGVIKGWTEALQLMPVGSKWQLFIPAELAYGQRAPGGAIGPNSTLIFEVELVSIQPKEAEKDAAKEPGAAQPATGDKVIPASPPKDK